MVEMGRNSFLSAILAEVMEKGLSESQDEYDVQLDKFSDSVKEAVMDFLDFMQDYRSTYVVDQLELEQTARENQDFIDNNPSTANWQKFWSRSADVWAQRENIYALALSMGMFLQGFIPTLGRKTERIVSVGSGPGLYDAFLAHHLPKIGISVQLFSVDYAETMSQKHGEILKFMRDWRDDVSRSNFRIVGDMQALPLPDGAVDHVFCNTCIDLVDDWKKAIAESRRVLDPKGGRTLYIFVHGTSLPDLYQKGIQPDDPETITYQRLRRHLSTTGFMVLDSQLIRGPQGMSRMYIRAILQ